MILKRLPHENVVLKERYKKKGKQYYKNTCRSCGRHIEYSHGNKPFICPYCGEEDYIKPETETRLFLLQKKFLKTRNEEILWSMFVLFREYSASLIKKSLPASFIHHYQDIEEKASELALIMFELYHSKPNFKIVKSFGAYLNTKVSQVLWNKKTQAEENHESLYTHIDSDDSLNIIYLTDILEYAPLYSQFEEYQQNKQNIEELLNSLEKFIKLIFTRIFKVYGAYYYILMLSGVLYRIKKGEHIENFYDTFGMKIKPIIEQTMVLIYSFLKDYERDYCRDENEIL